MKDSTNDSAQSASVARSSDGPPKPVPTKVRTLRNRLFEAKLRINEARQLNFQESKAHEESKAKKPTVSSRYKRAREVEDDQRRDQLRASGEDTSKTHIFDTVDDAERVTAKLKKKKKTHDKYYKGDFHEATVTGAMKKRTASLNHTDLKARYEELKKTLPEEMLYQGADSKFYGTTVVEPTKADIRNVQQATEEQLAKRKKYSRRRALKVGADVDYINERNRMFNLKVAKAYDKYTVEIKQNLERGTAI